MASRELRAYLGEEFSGLFENPRFIEAVPGHLSPDRASQQRLPVVMARLGELAALKGERED